MNFNFDVTWYTMTARENEKMYGCSVPFHPAIYTENGNKEIKICRNSTDGRKAFDNYIWSVGSTFTSEHTPCARFDVYFGLPDVDVIGNKKTEAFLRLYVKTDIRVKSTIIYYDQTTFAAEIGGYVGMFLGVSVIDLAIMFHSSVLSVVHKLFK